jgi:hypothetical protein
MAMQVNQSGSGNECTVVADRSTGRDLRALDQAGNTTVVDCESGVWRGTLRGEELFRNDVVHSGITREKGFWVSLVI